MLDSFKQKIACFVVNKKLKHHRLEKRSFKDFLKKSSRFLLLMPENEIHFHHALDVIKFFEVINKDVVIFTHDYRTNLLPQKYRAGAVDFSLEDINRINLPAKKLEARLKQLEFSAALDLNKEESLFNSLAANLVKSQVRAGFMKRNSDRYYNLQVSNSEDNPEIFYKNFLNCLQMF